jgi:hypothetical protein
MKANSNPKSKILTLLLTAVMLASATLPALAGDQVPFKGRGEGAITSAVPDPGGVVLTVLVKGNSTSLGRFSREETVLFDPNTGSLTGLVVFTAANRDELFATVEGGFISASTATGTYTFTGGTGRFANATGSAEFVVSSPDGTHVSVKFKGTLSSVGSNKR